MERFKHSHALGQNFLTDTNLLAAIVSDAAIGASDTVIEVGAGMGALTLPLVSTGARVIAFEIDKRLEPHLNGLSEGHDNLSVVFADFMRCDIGDYVSGSYKAACNLPYYITTPVLFKFLDDPACQSITVMVQKEVAERIVAKPGGKDYGALSVRAQLAGRSVITRHVSRRMFSPPPNVDSAVVRIDICSHGLDEKVNSVIRAAFSMRRKTLSNCLIASGFDRQRVEKALAALSLPALIRGERLCPNDFVALSKLLND